MPGLRDWLFSAKTFAAALLALYLGLWLDLSRPYWAMATVYIAAQPMSGATRSKAVYRAVGTVLGACAAVVIVPNLATSPLLLSLGMALWTGVCLFFALLDRSPRSYLFVLAGYTAPIIGFPAVTNPGAIFDVALSRTEEILLGVACATLVATLILPTHVGPVIATRVGRWLDNADQWTREALRGAAQDDAAARRQLAADLVEMDGMTTLLAWDASLQRDALALIRDLRAAMMQLLPVLSSISDRVAALRDRISADPPLSALLRAVESWLDQGAPMPPPESLRATLSAEQTGPGQDWSWDGVLIASLVTRVTELIELRGRAGLLHAAFSQGGGPVVGPLTRRDSAGWARTRHLDPAMALLSAAAAVIATLLSCLFWYATAWPDGAVAAQMAAVACSFFATQDDPVPAIVSFLRWAGLAVIIDGIYLFGLLPRADGFEMLALALAPMFLIYGVLITRPATAMFGVVLAANGATLLSLQETYAADFPSYANSGLAMLLGIAAGGVVTAIFRSVGAEWSVRRLMRASWRDLAIAAASYGNQERERFAALMLDRLGLLSPRIAALEPHSELRRVNGLAEVRIGLNLVELRRGRRALPEAARRAVEQVLDGVAEHYRRLADRLPPGDERGLLARLDRALPLVAQLAPGRAREDGLLGLVGLRRGLFPGEPAPAHWETDRSR